MTVHDQTFELVSVDQLTPHPENPRIGDVDVLAGSIQENGFYGAVVVQKSTGYVLAGNHRLKAARNRGIEEIPVAWVDVDDDRARRILLADNRTGDLGTYDDDLLADLLKDLAQTEEALRGTGYTPEDLDNLMALLDEQWDVPHGSGTDQDPGDDWFQPKIQLTISAETMDAWRTLLDRYDGENDEQKLEAHLTGLGLLDKVPAA